MTLVYGWWDWNAEASSLDNRVTGERVVYRGPAEVDASGLTGRWLRFDYVHPELTFPLLVEETVSPQAKDDCGKLWRLDYGRSSQLWCKECNCGNTVPAYGIWRRVDDCVSDAFTSWPETETVRLSGNFEFDGGWLNGSWNNQLRRSERYTGRRDETVASDDEFNPWTIPLDTPPPSPFVFHDYIPRRNGEENWDIENPVLLEGLTFKNLQLRNKPHLPHGTPLTGLEGRTAFLLSVDGRRLLYPFHGDTSRPAGVSHWLPKISFLYTDDQVVCSVTAFSRDRSEADTRWHIPLFSNCSARASDDDSAFFVVRPNGPNSEPSRALWLQMQWGIIDGLSNWPGSKARHPAWESGLKLFQTRSIMTSFSYKGGRSNLTSEVSVNL
jgi:hypothetical protein